MKITKLGHCCLVIEEEGLKVLTDPGVWTTAQNEVSGVDVVLITHEHPDHLHVESLKLVIANNPEVLVITNEGVGTILDEHAIPYKKVSDGESASIQEVLIEGFGTEHALIYPGVTKVLNTGYFVAKRFFYPGDNLFNPGKDVEILALPIAGPWLTIAQALDYAKEVKPKHVFPVHDGMLNPVEWLYKHPQRILPEADIVFSVIKPGDVKVF
jgi:L-ascorbate metabolism protein UlaG (beta-lactamase superfamily)